ncbi:MAG: EF-hand domain-containing protein [Pseudomonadota bacterium]|nr:EF-hand domain-containing protein [Pseudomonadota bacterium]
MSKKASVVLFTLVVGMVWTVSALAVPPKANNRINQMFERVDTDGDGKISAAEHAANAEDRFKRMDSDEDGYLTREEVDAAAKKAHKRIQEHKPKGAGKPKADDE